MINNMNIFKVMHKWRVKTGKIYFKLLPQLIKKESFSHGG
jgi:hypothetical protein